MKLAALFVLYLVLIWTMAGSAAAEDVPDGDRLAYDATVRCFIVNGKASGDAGDRGEKDAAARYEASARRSFDLAVKLGTKLGYSGQRIDQDFGLAQTKELPKMVADVTHYRSSASTCKALGLLG